MMPVGPLPSTNIPRNASLGMVRSATAALSLRPGAKWKYELEKTWTSPSGLKESWTSETSGYCHA